MIKKIDGIIEKNKSSIIELLVVILFASLYFSHFPFLSADADLTLGSGRGAWTDEGNYTSQIRNYINHNRFDISGYYTFLKTPLFSFFLLLPFKLFGTSMETARLTVLSFVMLMMMLFSLQKNYRLTGIILALTTLGLFPIYQHTHFALAEMMSIALVLVAGLLISLFNEKNKYVFLLCSFLPLAAAVFFKIQFLYVLFIPLLAIALNSLITWKSIFSRELFVSFLCLAVTALLMYAFWYLPFKYEWPYIMSVQGGISTGQPFSYAYIKTNLDYYFLYKQILPFSLSFLIALVLAAYGIIKKRFLPQTLSMVLFAIAWFILELHKLLMYYHPVRYMISVYFSMGLLVSTVFAHYLTVKNGKIVKLIVMICILSVLSGNLIRYNTAFNYRMYNISDINKYLAMHTNKDDVVIGSWAPALTWESKNVSFPVGSGSILGKSGNIFEIYKPQVVISEPGERDSNGAFKTIGVDLDAISVSSKQFKIAWWDVKIYWLKK